MKSDQAPEIQKTAAARTAIVVLGMHRSGTSALTRVLSLLGADLPSNLMAPAELDNPTGFWESLDVYRLNEEILQSAGSSWDDWGQVNPDWFRSAKLGDFRERALQMIVREFASSPLFVLKDPRICRLLPFWLDALQDASVEPRCILIVRNPLEVASSLKRRNDFIPPKSHMLWLRHVLDAEEGTRGLPRSFVTYEQLLSDWRAVVTKISLNLDIAWPRRSATSEVEIDTLLRDSLRHHTASPSDLKLHPDVVEWVKEAYSALSALAEGESDSRDGLAVLATVREAFDRACQALRVVVRETELKLEHTQQQQEASARSIAEQTARIEELSLALERRDAEVAEQAERIEELTRRVQGRDAEVTEQAGRIEELTRRAQGRESEVTELSVALTARDAQLQETENRISDLSRRLEKREGTLTEQRSAVEGLRAKIDSLESSLAETTEALAREGERASRFQNERNQLLFDLNARQSRNTWLIAKRLDSIERRWPSAVRAAAALPKWLWWTAGLKLPHRLRNRRDARAIMRSGLFDEGWYVDRNPDVVTSGYRPLMHWMLIGWKEGRDPNPAFDTNWYLQQYPDVEESGLNPLVHYIVRGASAGYDPSPRFNTLAYLAEHRDIVESGENPLAHSLVRAASADVEEAASIGGSAGVPIIPRSLQELADLISFPVSPSPYVSIIIPVHNHIDLTLQCLKSIQDCGANHSYEVLVVDDCSTDDTLVLLERIDGLRPISNDRNLGFTLSCNRGAASAMGTHLVFLNNDTVVNDGWLDALVGTITSQPRAGMVGAKLVYPNGRLQEAGGLVWRDGSARNVGRDDNPNKPDYCYLREVDYCSAACILIPRNLFERVGGFDERYAPAYYEDTDLAFKVRDAGLRVLFQPLALITHHEGGTAGLDVSKGVKRSQVTNQKKFWDRWAGVLESHGEPTPDVGLVKDRWVAARALVVDVWPTPDRDSGSIDTVNLLKALLAFNYKVTFFPANTLDHFGHYTTDLQRIGVECIFAPFVNSIDQFLDAAGEHIDVVFLRRVAFGGRHMEVARWKCPQAKIIFDTVDLHYLREERQAQLEQSWELKLAAAATKALELEYVKKSDGTIVVSEYEKKELEKERPEARIWWMPFSRDIPGRSAPFGERADIMFVGGFLHQPNVDAVDYFLSTIWPMVTSRLPGVRFLIVGSDMPVAFHRWASPTVVPVGHVRSLDRYLNRCRMTVAPLRFGAGTKGKVVTSMSCGVPVVATPLAVEGMSCQAGEHVLIGEKPEEFADAIAALYSDEGLWTHLSDNGLSLVRSMYSHEAGHRRLSELLGHYGLHAAPAFDVAHAGSRGAGEYVYEEAPCAFAPNDSVRTGAKSDVRVVAFYLPQFHPIPENDLWWGKGFTEWTNVTRARPLFPGHYQPHLPGELGFYDLRVPEVREAQASLAREYGVHGFCYYHYWFSGKRLLERPFNEVLRSGQPDLPFCLCWANENWTRRWDGRDNQVLMEQVHTTANDRRFIQELLPALGDERYIRIDGKPLLLVYRTELLPDPKRTSDIWREECVRSGIGDLYLCRAESFTVSDPADCGFDAAYEFPPLNVSVPELHLGSLFVKGGGRGHSSESRFDGKLFPYDELVRHMCDRSSPQYKRFRGVMVAWDNTPRRSQDGYVWLRSTPALFQRWLSTVIGLTREQFLGEERIVFVNAWNEWAEGCHLEPDQRNGRLYLEAVRHALSEGAGQPRLASGKAV
jgi:GT2 family glycosyltransferase/glycosyltransferase involved in cell wall biosynthesis